MLDDAAVVELLRANWALVDPMMTTLGRGLTSATWTVDVADRRFVAKAVEDAGDFLGGLEVAEALDARGLRTGCPVRTAEGSLAVSVGSLRIALLRWERGRPVDVTARPELVALGQTLARAHALMRHVDVPATLLRWPWRWLMEGEHLDIEPALRSAVVGAVEDAEAAVEAGQLRLGLLHGDPNAQEFLWDGDAGDVALIDWGACTYGPVLYDVASVAVLSHLSSGQFATVLEAYADRAALPAEELEGLETCIRLRWAVQAAYFAARLFRNVSTGGAGREFNAEGVRRSLAALLDGKPTTG